MKQIWNCWNVLWSDFTWESKMMHLYKFKTNWSITNLLDTLQCKSQVWPNEALYGQLNTFCAFWSHFSKMESDLEPCHNTTVITVTGKWLNICYVCNVLVYFLLFVLYWKRGGKKIKPKIRKRKAFILCCIRDGNKIRKHFKLLGFYHFWYSLHPSLLCIK